MYVLTLKNFVHKSFILNSVLVYLLLNLLIYLFVLFLDRAYFFPEGFNMGLFYYYLQVVYIISIHTAINKGSGSITYPDETEGSCRTGTCVPWCPFTSLSPNFMSPHLCKILIGETLTTGEGEKQISTQIISWL